jgi:hypothetical protein
MLAELTGAMGVVFTLAVTVAGILIAIRLVLLAGRLVRAVENIAGILEKSGSAGPQK